jgi:hypothetical protein
MSEIRYCSNCGTTVGEGALFCSRCGRPIPQAQPASATPAGGAGPSGASPSYRYERHERHEKNEKREKGEKQEKGGRNGWIGPVFGGSVLIWLGIILTLGFYGTIHLSDWWNWFLVGLGIILILEGAAFSISRGRPYPFIGFFIGGIIIFLVGFAPIFTGFNFWPLILVIIGIFIIAGSLLGRRRAPKP